MACSRLAVALCFCLGIGAATPDGWRRCELGSCQDERADCSALAERGMCFSDPAFMDANCKKACGHCPAAVPTACDGNATCCRHPFSNSGVGCCPFGSGAVCCNDYTCCPAGTACRDSGSGYRVTTRCVQPRTGSAVAQGKQICKPGAALPLSAVQRNCLIIGDSVSIGYTPAVNRLLSGTPGGCMVQHSPFSGDGGAEETAYGLQCLEYFLRSADGEEIAPRLDLIYFNWGLHNLVPDSESVVPGQSGHQADYLPNLANITARLSALRSRFGVRLLFGLTSPEMCEASQDDVVVRLNAQARKLMAAERIPTVDLHAAVVGACGRPPQGTCLGKAGGGCPHYSRAGYEWIANSTLVPAFRAALSDGAPLWVV